MDSRLLQSPQKWSVCDEMNNDDSLEALHRKAMNSLLEVARSLAKGGWSKERAELFDAECRAACDRFVAYEGWQRRVPAVRVMSDLSKIERAARAVARYGFAELKGDGCLEGTDLKRITRAYNLPKRSSKQFHGNLEALRKLLPDRSEVPDNEFGDKALASALIHLPHVNDVKIAGVAATILDASKSVSDLVCACHFLAKRAGRGVRKVRKTRLHTVPKGHQGDYATNVWFDETLELYKRLTGKAASVSVFKPSDRDEGKPNGPWLRFLTAAYEPLIIRMKLANEVDKRHFEAGIQNLPEHEQQARRWDYEPLFPERCFKITPAGWRSRVVTSGGYDRSKMQTARPKAKRPAKKKF
jgi:hypothetical protein